MAFGWGRFIDSTFNTYSFHVLNSVAFSHRTWTRSLAGERECYPLLYVLSVSHLWVNECVDNGMHVVCVPLC